MNWRLFKTMFVILVPGAAIAMSSVAQATMITAMKDSADFPAATRYDGADLLGSDWSTSGSPNGTAEGTLLRFSPASGANWYQWGQSFTHSVGWTIEASYKITLAESSGTRVWDIISGDGGPNQENHMYFASDSISYLMNGTKPSSLLASGDFTQGFHTMRIAEPAGSGKGDTHVWVDGQLVSDTLVGYNHPGTLRLLVGDTGSAPLDGEVLIEYVRVDKTGAFAPIPEPSALVLLGMGLAMIGLRRAARCRRR